MGVINNSTTGIGFNEKTTLQIGAYASENDSTLNPLMYIKESSVGIGVSPTVLLDIQGSSTGEDSEGLVHIDNTSTAASPGTKILVLQDGVVEPTFFNGGPRFIEFKDNAGTILGHIRHSGNEVIFLGYATETSDKRLKENIKPLSLGIDTLLQLQPVEFTWKKNKKSSKGFIAQDLYKVYPDAVLNSLTDDVENDPWTITQTKLIPLLVKSIQDQQKIIDELKERITQLEKNNK